MILAVINAKGGTAKTTTAVHLAAALAAKGKRTLLVDLDSQASASLSLGVNRAALTSGVAEAIVDGRSLNGAIQPTSVPLLELVAGTPDLADADLRLATVAGRERRLAAALMPVRRAYDFVILDCPPSLSLLPVNALTAADAYLVPTPPEYLALEGLVGLMTAVERIQSGLGGRCQLLGILLTKVDYRRRVTGEIIDVIRRHYGRQVFRTEIRVDVRLVEAPSFGRTVFDYAPGSAGADAYHQLADEVIKRKGTMS